MQCRQSADAVPTRLMCRRHLGCVRSANQSPFRQNAVPPNSQVMTAQSQFRRGSRIITPFGGGQPAEALGDGFLKAPPGASRRPSHGATSVIMSVRPDDEGFAPAAGASGKPFALKLVWLQARADVRRRAGGSEVLPMGAGRSDKREAASTAVTQQSNCKGNSDLRLIRTPDRYAGHAYACPRGLCVTLFPQPSVSAAAWPWLPSSSLERSSQGRTRRSAVGSAVRAPATTWRVCCSRSRRGRVTTR